MTGTSASVLWGRATKIWRWVFWVLWVVGWEASLDLVRPMDAQLRWDLAFIECLVVVVLLKPHFCGVVRLLPLWSAVAMGRVLIGLQQSSQSYPKRWTNWRWLHQHCHSTSCHMADTSCRISCVYKILSVMSFGQTLWCTVSCYITILHPYYLYIFRWSDTSWSLPHADTSCSNVLMECFWVAHYFSLGWGGVTAAVFVLTQKTERKKTASDCDGPTALQRRT